VELTVGVLTANESVEGTDTGGSCSTSTALFPDVEVSVTNEVLACLIALA
jgi:hypothetical protein